MLRPSPNFPTTFVLRISFPNLLLCPAPCISTIYIYIYIYNLERENPLTITSQYSINIPNVRNPILPSLYSDVDILVTALDPDLTMILHESNISLSNSGYFKSHTLTNVNLQSSSANTVTKSSYTFKFKNANYKIYSGSKILIIFPIELQFLTTTPTVSNILILSNSLSATYSHPNMTISDAFPSNININNNLQFTISDILNPYKTGLTSTFKIIIHKNNNSNLRSFELLSGLTANIPNIAQFPVIIVNSGSLRTNDVANYTYEVKIGDGSLNSSHIIKFQIPGELQGCDKNTILEISGLLPIINIYTSADNFWFEVPGDVTAMTTIKFQIECVNPYTTEPMSTFNIWGMEGSNIFYTKTVNIAADMNIMHPFQSITFTKTNNSPRYINTFTFSLQSSMSLSFITTINQIQITISGGLEVLGCNIINLSGVTGTLICTLSGQIITISGVTQLDNIFEFKLSNIRNPSLAATPIWFNILTKHSAGYFGENSTTINDFVGCDFPCKTCGAPTQCLSCYPNMHEVFTVGGTSYHMLYLSGKQCLSNCGTVAHIYVDSVSSCGDCHAICNECDTISSNCTKCYPNTFLYDNQCVDPCPTGYEKNITDWTCFRIYIYIYIIYSL